VRSLEPVQIMSNQLGGEDVGRHAIGDHEKMLAATATFTILAGFFHSSLRTGWAQRDLDIFAL